MIDVVGYCRLSDKKETSWSIASQKSRIQEYCDRYNLNLLQIFTDDGKSGWTFDRPGFLQLEAFCRLNKSVRMLIIPHFDRFSRADPIDAMVKERHFRDKFKIKVLQLSEPPETDTENSTYQIIRFMQAYAANEERNRIVERVTTSIRYRSLQGRYCNHAPYGYKHARDLSSQAIIVIDEAKAEIVKLIFLSYLSGNSIEEVKRLACKRGFHKKGNSAIQRILSTCTYAGLISVAAYKNLPAKIVKGIHDPIITENQYWKAQELMNGKKFVPMKRPEVPLRGVIKCAHCMKLLTAAPSKNKSGKYYWYYFCNQHRKENFSAIKIHKQLSQILEAISITGDKFVELREKLTAALQSHINSQTKELMRVDLSIRALENSIENIEVQQLTTPVSAASYNRVITEKNNYLADLVDRREKLKTGTIDYMARLEVALSQMTNLRSFFESLELQEQQGFMREVFGCDLVYTRGNYRTPFLHPVFYLKAVSLKGLPLVIEKQNPLKSGSKLLSGLDGSATEPSFEFIESFLAIFAA